jgi:hypothetical protein
LNRSRHSAHLYQEISRKQREKQNRNSESGFKMNNPT